jgi:cytochrome c556
VRGILQGLGLTVLACTSTLAVGDDQDAIDYRVHVMTSIGEQLAAIDMILAKKAPPDSFAVHVKVIATVAAQAKLAFEPKIAGGNSKPEVWSNWADFSKRLDAMVAASDELAKAAKDGNPSTVGPKIRTSLDCEGCHKLYMKAPKS